MSQPTTFEKVEAVVALMKSIMTREERPQDGGHCGPRGRTISARSNPDIHHCDVSAVFCTPYYSRYVLQLSMTISGVATQLDIISAAVEVAKLQAKIPRFEPEENDAVVEAINKLVESRKISGRNGL